MILQLTNLQWILGNTFPFVVFTSFGAFWLGYGATTFPGVTEAITLDKGTGLEAEAHRLTTHINETRNVLASNAAIGRRLDFLMQEFNREANTLGSKSVDARSTQSAVELKVLIEQMREQVQNIE